MAIGKVINEQGVGLFPFSEIFQNLGYEVYHSNWEMQLLLQIPNITKADILEYFEYCIFGLLIGGIKEGDDIIINTYHIDKLDDDIFTNKSNPTYISGYINIIGQLFLAGYIDFGSYCDDKDRSRIDYPTNLSYYQEDKYQAWVYFRDNFFYANRFNMDLNDPTTSDENGYSLILGDTSWDTPEYWSQYNIWVARTEKGTQYFDEILSPRFYEKYKDLSVEIDSKGKILRWIGEVNR